ncbi:MAG: TonB family protein [Acidobacteria bacterium]|nr:TonB family protein [Acidobacteriota bacterium]
MSGLLDAALKSTVLFAIALLADRLLLRRASAAVRHTFLIATLVGVLILPVLAGITPSWRIPIPNETTGLLFRVDAAGIERPVAVTSGPIPGPPASRPVPWPRVVLCVWLAGVLAVLARSVAGAWMIRRIARRSALAPAFPMARAAGLDVDVRLSAPGTMPLVFGFFRPTVLLPAEAVEWPEDQLNMVLLHEFAHIRRRDMLWQTLGDLACALYWPHPLVWMLHRDALRRREAAADDLVLEAGVRPSDYAQRLLELAQLESRLLAILATGANRAPASRRLIAAAVVAVCTAAMALATVRAVAEDPSPMEAGGLAATQRFDFSAAVTYYQAALSATKDRFGDNSVEFARMLVKLANALQTAHEISEAHAAIDRSIRIFEVVAPFDPAYAEALYRSGIRYQLDKNFDKAREAYERGLEVARVNGDRRLSSRMRPNLNSITSGADLSGAVSSRQFAEPEPNGVPAHVPRVPLTPGTYRIGGGVSPPALLNKVEPVYSDEARAFKWQGVAVLYTEISSTGTPENIQVVRPLGLGLDEEAVRAVRQWVFRPGTKDGTPVRVAATIEVNFRLL